MNDPKTSRGLVILGLALAAAGALFAFSREASASSGGLVGPGSGGGGQGGGGQGGGGQGGGGGATLPPSAPLPGDAGAGYLHPDDVVLVPPNFHSMMLWVSPNCRSWLIGADYIPTVDDLTPYQWWWDNALDQYQISNFGLEFMSPNIGGPEKITPDVRYLYALLEEATPACAGVLPRMDQYYVNDPGQEYGNPQYVSAIDQLKNSALSSFYLLGETLLGLIQRGWALDDENPDPWSMGRAIMEAEGEIDFGGG